MNVTRLSTTKSLTGQAKVQSLNTIYNRVTLLKSKNVNRKLIQKDNSSSLNYLPFDQQPSIQNKVNGLQQPSDSAKFLINKQKFLQDKQTDNLQTNFWPSQGNIQSHSKNYATLKQRPQTTLNFDVKGRRKFVSTKQALNKISKTFTSKPQFQNNRVYLMSDFKNNLINETNGQMKNQKNMDLISKKSHQTRKRPMTSSVGRQRMSFRINQMSRVKQKIKKNSTPSSETAINNSLSQMKLEQKQSKKSLTGSRVSLLKGQSRANVYKKQIRKFQQLYECLSMVLESIKQGFDEVQKSVTAYANLIQLKRVSFVDDFIESRQPKLQKLVRTTRLFQTLSICYLFLQIAQQRIQDNESYLVNFIGHSLSNLLLVLRLYMIKQRKSDFQKSQFQEALREMQKASFGEELTSLNDILLRIQHNNEIISMIHKRLGRNNQKFESCIQNFFKNAQRQKYSCSLCAHYIFEFLSMHIHELQMLGISPTLQLAPQPYTPPAEKQYTLVIEPLGILQRNGKYRPYMNQFMKWASKNFDIVLWTWQLPYAVEHIYEVLSPYITSRLYRHHCTLQNEIFVKDISRLGRNLQKTIIIDFDKRIFGHHLSNGIQCRWKGSQNDKNLLVLSQIFEEMISSATNIADTLTFYAQQILSIRGY